MARSDRSDIEQQDLEGNPIEKADVENTESVTPYAARTTTPVGTTEALDGDPRYPISKVGDEPTDPDEPDQNDVTSAVKAHNDAEIAKAREALGEANPKTGTTTTSSEKYQG